MPLVHANGLRFTVIIPTHNDAGLVVATIHTARSLGDVQVMVVDSAATTDDTRALARREGAKTLRPAGDRGRQMRAAVAAASGDVLLFLPPGAQLAPDALDAVKKAVADTEVLGGVFQARLGGGNALLRLMYGALRLVGMQPYGAPWFVWRTAAEARSGFRPLRVFEDRDLLSRLRHRGKLVTLNSTAILDSGHGLHRLLWTLLQVPHALGVPAKLLGRLYHKPRSPAGDRPATAVEAVEDEVIPPVGKLTG